MINGRRFAKHNCSSLFRINAKANNYTSRLWIVAENVRTFRPMLLLLAQFHSVFILLFAKSSLKIDNNTMKNACLRLDGRSAGHPKISLHHFPYIGAGMEIFSLECVEHFSHSFRVRLGLPLQRSEQKRNDSNRAKSFASNKNNLAWSGHAPASGFFVRICCSESSELSELRQNELVENAHAGAMYVNRVIYLASSIKAASILSDGCRCKLISLSRLGARAAYAARHWKHHKHNSD